jgi:hypothetical protein
MCYAMFRKNFGSANEKKGSLPEPLLASYQALSPVHLSKHTHNLPLAHFLANHQAHP